MTDKELLERALRFYEGCPDGQYDELVVKIIRERLGQQPAKLEPVALKWQQAPIRTAWGDDMVVASVAIDKDHTVDLYCEREQIAKVEVMFTSPPAQRKPLMDELLRKMHHEDQFGLFCDYDEFEQIARAIEAAHGIKE